MIVVGTAGYRYATENSYYVYLDNARIANAGTTYLALYMKYNTATTNCYLGAFTTSPSTWTYTHRGISKGNFTYDFTIWLIQTDSYDRPTETIGQRILETLALEKYKAQTPEINVRYTWQPYSKLYTPTGLYADNITSDSARTNWQAVDNASNYKVQYKAAGDTVWTETYTD